MSSQRHQTDTTNNYAKHTNTHYLLPTTINAVATSLHASCGGDAAVDDGATLTASSLDVTDSGCCLRLCKPESTRQPQRMQNNAGGSQSRQQHYSK